MWLSKPVYEALPYYYVVLGAIALLARLYVDYWYWPLICTIVGGLPLILASGAGAEARIALGWVIVGGLGLATVSTLFLTPVVYLLLGRWVTPKVEEEKRLRRELEAAEEKERQLTPAE